MGNENVCVYLNFAVIVCMRKFVIFQAKIDAQVSKEWRRSNAILRNFRGDKKIPRKSVSKSVANTRIEELRSGSRFSLKFIVSDKNFSV